VTERIAILADGQLTFHDAKTAFGVIRYGTDPVVALIDRANAGRRVSEWIDAPYDVPVVASLEDALVLGPTVLVIGIAPTGGLLPPEWRALLLRAMAAGLHIRSGLHQILGDDPELAAAAASAGVTITDYRRPPERRDCAVGRSHAPGKRVLLTVGTDCAVGKMSVSLELVRAAREAGDAAVFVPTGQTGQMIAGWGVAVDRLISDFLNGTVEWLVEEGEARGDWLLVEGQGSLDHPAYSSVTLGLIHGATPHAMVLVHQPGLADHDFAHVPDRVFPLAPLPAFIDLHERVASVVAPSRVVAVALNTSLIADPDEARRVIAATEAETGLPCDDPFRFGPERLWPRIRTAVEALPWVEASA
jgi:uncharacterized NAD-dependent epimerase/dehydratase family protein